VSRREELTNPLAPTPLRRRAKQHRATLAAGYRLGPEDYGWLAVNVTDRGALLDSFKHTLGAAVGLGLIGWVLAAMGTMSSGPDLMLATLTAGVLVTAVLGLWSLIALTASPTKLALRRIEKQMGEPVVAPAGPAGELVRKIVSGVARLPDHLRLEMGPLVAVTRQLVADLEAPQTWLDDGSPAAKAAEQARRDADFRRMQALAERAAVVTQLTVEADAIEALHRQHEAAAAERAVAEAGIDDHDLHAAQMLHEAVADVRRRLAADAL